MQNDVQKNTRKFMIVAGMARTGTTSLYHNLEKHPALFLPIYKEMFFFSLHYARGLEWFLDFYRKAGPEQICVDISPDYFHHDHVIERIQQFDPHAKIILCVRDPVEWAFSLYNEVNMFDFGLPSFQEFIKGHTICHGDKKVRLDVQHNAISRRIKEYQDAFGDNLLLYDFKMVRRDLLSVLQAIEQFAHVPPYFNEKNCDTMAFNAGNRRNIKFLYYIIYHEIFIAFLRKMFPDKLLRALRRQYYRVTARRKITHPALQHSQEDIDAAEEMFADDRRFIQELFAEHAMQSGTGKPFPEGRA